MRACPACGASNGPTDDFCGNCGTYLGWSDSTTAPGTSPPQPTASTTTTDPSEPAVPAPAPAQPADGAPPAPVPAPAPPPAEEPASAAPGRGPSLRTRLTGRGRPEAGAATTESAAAPRDSGGPAPVPTPAREMPTGPTPRTGEPAPTTRPGPNTPLTSNTPPTSNTPAPPTTPATPPTPPAPDPIQPVRPARPVAPRPVVRPVPVADEVAGAPCPSCGTPNPPDRRFCRRCATPLNPAPKPDPLPWWRTVWPFRRRVRAGSGSAVRLLVILAVVLALCAGGFLLLPAGRALFEDTRDKLGKAKPVTPVGIKASAQSPRHPARNTTDGLSNSYWGAPAAGASVTYTFAKPFRLVDLIINNGPSPNPEDYSGQARALRMDLEVTAQDGRQHHKQLTLGDKPGPQTFTTGFSDVKTVRLTLREPVGLTPDRQIALAEVEFFQRS